jgi:SpoVK/Ycf46/Vps4 family AAA+-type ATPase
VARLYPQGRGLVALLAGPPGTGKTMAAQVIAAEIGMDLLRVDLSAVVSKWVGETSQHLQKILSARVSRHAVLFFDEADALYGKRVEETRDAQDRYANMDISHLMVALENFDGVVLLASNLKGNIDGAFLRRIRHCVEFTRPDVAARKAIWQRVTSTLFPGTHNISLDQLASLEATGAQIKQAALSAAFAARRLACEPHTLLLAQMLAREMAKDGGGISARELTAALGLNDTDGGHW